MATMLGKTISVDFRYIALEGELVTRTYGDGVTALILDTDQGPETLSTNLGAYGIYPATGNVIIKDYSEHDGVTASLVRAGAVRVVREITFGQFNTKAFEVEVL